VWPRIADWREAELVIKALSTLFSAEVSRPDLRPRAAAFFGCQNRFLENALLVAGVLSATRTPSLPGPPSACGLNPDLVVNGGSNPLLAAEVPFRGLDRDMPKEKLDLLQFAAGRVAEPGASPAEVVRR